uniref:Uncharacterized protein n=1 Tax=Kalanchoe fedtschenkoi TaxID=63787 RepID=A0A7N0SVZ4_KALFE
MASSYSFTGVSVISVTWALAAVIVWLITRLLFRRGHRRASFPPGPSPWPVLGNLNLLGKIPHQSLHKLSKTHGPLVHLKFGSSYVVVTNSPDMAKEFLKSQDSAFASRPQLAAGKYFTYNFSDITWGQGPHWRQGRRIFSTHLFNSKRLDSYENVRVEERRDFLGRLYDLRGRQVRVRDHLSQLNLSIMSRVMLGKKYFSELEHLNDKSTDGSIYTLGELQEMFDELQVLSGVFVIGDWIPWLARFDLGGYVKKMKRLSLKFDRLFDLMIKEHKMAGDGPRNERPKDMMDILLDLVDDPELEVKLTTDNVKGFTMDILAGGTDTSATTVEWAMAELMKNPEKIQKATEEVDRVVGKERWVEEKDIRNLPYLDAVMKETMRLHPATTLLIPRVAAEDCQIGHYDIPKGTLVLINTWSMGRDPTLWDSPEEFRPERFLNMMMDIKGQSFELLPFGSGRRMCPGYSLGIKMIQSSLANLLHGFSWTLPQKMKPRDLDMEEIYGLTTPRMHPLLAVGEPRLPSHLYDNLSPL